jgi:hypothetical protein
MHINTDKDAIIVNSSHLPVIRAGYSNIIFLLFAIALILANQVLVDLNTAIYSKIIVFLVMCYVALKLYTHSVSRLYIKDKKSLVFIGPISKSIIDVSKIKMTKVYGIPSSMTMLIQVKKKDAAIPIFYFFVAISTNCGSFMDTKIKLISLLRKLDSAE